MPGRTARFLAGSRRRGPGLSDPPCTTDAVRDPEDHAEAADEGTVRPDHLEARELERAAAERRWSPGTPTEAAT
jgi:hypothetical protein